MNNELRTTTERWVRRVQSNTKLVLASPKANEENSIEHLVQLQICDHLLTLLQPTNPAYDSPDGWWLRLSGEQRTYLCKRYPEMGDTENAKDTCGMVPVADVRSLVQEIKSARDPHEEEAAIQHLESLYTSPRENAEPVGEVMGCEVTGERWGALYGQANDGPEVGAKLYTSPPREPASVDPCIAAGRHVCGPLDAPREGRDHEGTYLRGMKDGLTAYAWWRDGVQYVGTCGQTLEAAIALATEGEQE